MIQICAGNIFFIKSYHTIQLFVRPFNFKINIMENRKTHFILAVIEYYLIWGYLLGMLDVIVDLL